MGKANEKRKKGKVKRAKDEEVKGQGRRKAERGYAGPTRCFKVENSNCPYHSEGQCESSCLILCRSVKALRKYGRFYFQDGSRLPS